MIPLVLALAVSAPVQRVIWSDGGRRPGIVVPAGKDKAFESLRLVNDADTARTFTVAVLDHPGVSASRWVIRGRVRYEAVQGHGYLEMWNVLDKGGTYFSRTLGASGPMQWLSGTSVWREFALPFDANAAPDVPRRLVVNVVFPGRGTIELSPLDLYQGTLVPPPLPGSPGSTRSAWWSDSLGGWIGGVAGSLLGILGAVIASLIARGRGRQIVRALLTAEFAIGVASLAAGLVALAQHQPYGVWYPLVLLGGFLCLWAPFFLRLSARRYQEIELRRMTAFDTAR